MFVILLKRPVVLRSVCNEKVIINFNRWLRKDYKRRGLVKKSGSVRLPGFSCVFAANWLSIIIKYCI